MARGVCVGLVVTMFAITGASRVAAAPSPVHRGADVKFTVGGSTKESIVTAEGLGVRVTKRVGPDTVRIRIEAAKDVIDVQASATGNVRLGRGGRTIDINMAARDPKLLDRARRMVAGSAALQSFNALIGAIGDDQRTVAKSMLTSWALVHAASGSDAPAMSVARRFQAAAKGTFTPARSIFEREETPIVCWAEYASTVTYYYLEYAQCLLDYSWIPGGAQVCSFEWIIKAELAWFWLIGCSGGVPV
jgi:hypothetical protein